MENSIKSCIYAVLMHVNIYIHLNWYHILYFHTTAETIYTNFVITSHI